MELVKLDIDKEFPSNLCQNKNSVFQFELTQIDNSRLVQFILELEKKKGKQLTATNRGGWHSDRQLFKHNKETFQQLHDIIKKCIEKILNTDTAAGTHKVCVDIQHSWANINRKDHYNVKHKHGRIRLVACYYVSTDTTKNAEGEFVAIYGNESIKIFPKSGMLLIFPGNMYHEVLKYKGVKPRISIACNSRIKK